MNGRCWRLGALCAALLIPTLPGNGQQSREPVATTPHFAFYSDFSFNLHDALVAAGTARRTAQAERFAAEPEATCFNELPPEQRAAWNRAVDYYAEIIAAAQAFDRPQLLPRLELLWGTEEWARGDDRLLITITRAFRSAAAQAYQRCRWQAQDARNRRWIDALRPILARHEDTVARRLEELYGSEWTVLPIPVDIVETVSWAGADAISTSPPPGHIWVSSTFDGYRTPSAGLEVVFHEASHLLAGDGSPLRAALDAAQRATGRTAPRDLWHSVLFYMTGEAVRRELVGADEPGYTPLIYALDLSGNARDSIASAWTPYLDGERTLSEVAGDLFEALRSSR
jgi:hypothetical protein